MTTRVVAALTVASATAYLVWSRELRYQLAGLDYGWRITRGFLRERGLGAVRLLHGVDPSGALLVLAWLGSVALAATTLVRAVAGTRDRGRTDVERCAAMLAAAIVPTLALATLRWPDGRGALRSIPIIVATLTLAAVAEAVARWRTRALRREEPVTDAAPVHDRATGATQHDATVDDGARWVWAFVALLVPLVLAAWWNGIDSIRGFDSQSDHLPRAARWLRLSRLSDESGELLTPYYPGNFLVLVRWLLALGTDRYTFVASLASSCLCLALLYRICRALGQGRRTALVSSLSAASVTLVPYLATTVQADMAMTACLLLAVLALLRWAPTTVMRQDADPSTALRLPLALGASVGLAVGVKYSALPPALGIVAIVARYAWRGARERDAEARVVWNARTFVVSMATIAGAALACGGYWLVRNLVEHGNPLYPVATAGLPGVDMRTIIPVKPALVGSFWHRATYPWVQWDFGYVYDDGLGAVFPAVAIIGFLATLFRWRDAAPPTRLLWVVTLVAYVLWIGTGSITPRFGLFPVLLTFCFVGELWRHAGSRVVKSVTVATFAVSVLATTKSLVVGAVYTAVVPLQEMGVPRLVDSLPPSRIFNACLAANRYRLLGADYRHEVVTQFDTPTPQDMVRARPDYVLLSPHQVPAFTAALPMERVASTASIGGDTLSLWRVNR